MFIRQCFSDLIKLENSCNARSLSTKLPPERESIVATAAIDNLRIADSIKVLDSRVTRVKSSKGNIRVFRSNIDEIHATKGSVYLMEESSSKKIHSLNGNIHVESSQAGTVIAKKDIYLFNASADTIISLSGGIFMTQPDGISRFISNLFGRGEVNLSNCAINELSCSGNKVSIQNSLVKDLTWQLTGSENASLDLRGTEVIKTFNIVREPFFESSVFSCANQTEKASRRSTLSVKISMAEMWKEPKELRFSGFEREDIGDIYWKDGRLVVQLKK